MLNPLVEIPPPSPPLPDFIAPEIPAIAELPLARQAFSRDWPVHYMGKMEVECPDCGALHWRCEKLKDSPQIRPKFGTCCFSGKIQLPKIEDPPVELLNYLRGDDPISKGFRDNIRQYNNALAMTSLGCNQDHSINTAGGGPWVFKVQGRLCHKSGSLIPREGATPVFAQLYIFDPKDALRLRMGNQANAALNRTVMNDLQDMLYRQHPAVHLYQQALEKMRNMGPDQDHRIALHFDENTDHRRYNLPTVTSNEIAAIIPGDGDQFQSARDIILYERGGGLKEISDKHPLYSSLHYVLLFPTGQLGWHPNIPHIGVQNQGNQDEEDAPGDPRARGKVTQSQYFKYRLHPRNNESNHIFMAGKLLQEYAVDAWATTEQRNLDWVKNNQKTIRAETYQGLVDAVAHDPNANPQNIGQRIILPSSFSGSSRSMIQNCQDALAINRHFGGADFFLTMTANPNWPEIKEALLPGQSPPDRPDLVNRVFKAKFEALKEDMFKKGYLGKTRGRVWTTEFQKRGLPHCHLILFLHPNAKLRTPEELDSLLSAEFPDPDEQPELFELVLKFMVHTPCGPQNPTAPCMKNGKCSKGFPKPFREETTINDDSYANLRRRNTGKKYKLGNHWVDNRWIVTYPIFWLWVFRCHINMECLFSIKGLKYIYKYVYKGHDRTTMEFGRCQDEIKLYLDSRYVSAHEAIWRLFQFSMHEESPSIYRLQVHLPGDEMLFWNGDTVNAIENIPGIQGNKHTMLTGYFKANEDCPEARDILYSDFPAEWVWSKKNKKWTKRKQGDVIGRMYYAHPNSGERFYLRTLLASIKGATSFEDLKTVNGVIHATFHAACLAHGLLEDDNEWSQCLQEAAQMASGYQLRQLFVTILRDCSPSDPLALWLQFRVHICDDLQHALRSKNIVQNPTEEQVFDYGLYLIDQMLHVSNKRLRDWPSMPLPQMNWEAAVVNRFIAEQQSYDIEEQKQLAAQRIPTLNQDQLAAFNAIVNAVETKSGQSFFLHGAGGTGKTYVYNTLCHFLRGQNKIVLCVASSGIASLLLIGGRTSHSTFKIPIVIHESSTCAIQTNSDLAELIRMTDLVIWDEAPMQHKHIHEAVNRTFQDIMKCQDKLFGGLTIVFGGDFKQILPVVVKGSRAEIVGACMQRSHIWGSIKVIKLKQNMRLNTNVEAERNFAKWQLDIGHGKHTNEGGLTTLPDYFKCPENNIESLIQSIYPGINQLPLPDQYFAERTILTSRNDDVDDINDELLKQFPGEEREYMSADSLKNNDNNPEGDLMYSVEYLNSINCSGLPLAKLKLKMGCPVMILRNLEPSEGVCNGSRGVVTRMSNRVLEVRLLTGQHAGNTVFIPRLSITPSETQVPFEFCRRQFPVKVCFAMSINKSQGQTVKYVGLDLRNAVFTHGQLYVAISRVTSVHNIKAIWDSNVETPVTKNIVYPEVIID